MEPGIARVTPQGTLEHTLGRLEIAAVEEGPSEQVEADGGQVRGRGPGQRPELREPGISFDDRQGVAEPVAPGVGVGHPRHLT